MAKQLKALWNGMNSNKEDAHMLADVINRGLSPENHTIVIQQTETWFIVAGNERAEKWYEELSAELTNNMVIN